jgi:hypothetical protein
MDSTVIETIVEIPSQVVGPGRLARSRTREGQEDDESKAGDRSGLRDYCDGRLCHVARDEPQRVLDRSIRVSDRHFSDASAAQRLQTGSTS